MLLLNPKNLQPAEDQRLVLYDIAWQQSEQFSNLIEIVLTSGGIDKLEVYRERNYRQALQKS